MSNSLVFKKVVHKDANQIIYTEGVGIGTTTTLEKLHVQGNMFIQGDLIPSACNVYDIGTSNLRFKDLYLSGNTIDLGGTRISRSVDNGQLIVSTPSGLPATISANTITVSSSNLVTNLNAQYLNNQEGSFYQNATNINDGALDPLYGGTGATTVTGTGSNVLSASPTFTGTVQMTYLNASQDVSCYKLSTTAPQGIKPLSILSTTKVTNLNADLLDNQEGSFYQNATNINDGALNPLYGGTGATGVTGSGSNVLSDSPTLTGNIQADNLTASGTVAANSFQVTSSNLVTNLNADLLDNQQGSFYTNVNNMDAGTLPVARGGTGQSSLTANKILVGNNTSGILQPANLHWDSGTNRLGINNQFPSNALDVVGNAYVSGTITASNLSIIGDFVTMNTVTSNTEQMVINNIGTGPALRVTQTGNTPLAEFFDSESGSAMFIDNNGLIGFSTNVPLAKLYVLETGSVDAFRVDDQVSDSTPFIIKADGLVGIGTTAPQTALQVEGQVRSSQGYAVAGNAVIDSNRNLVNIGTISTTGSLTVSTNTLPAVLVTPSGGSTVNGTPMVVLAAGSGSFAGMQYYADGSIRLGFLATASDLSNTLCISKATNAVGVGTTTPQELLQVEGNIALSGAARFIGTRTNHNLSLRTNNTDRITIDNNGNVGIGTINPIDALHINRNTRTRLVISSVGGQPISDNNWNPEDEYGTILFGATGNLGGFSQYPAAITAISETNAYTADSFNQAISGALVFKTVPTSFSVANNSVVPLERLRINKDGRVGIGTTSPQETLHVEGFIRSSSGYKVGNTTIIDSSNNILNVNFLTTLNTMYTYSQANDTYGAFTSGNGAFLSIESFNLGNTVKRPIVLNAYGGNVGIGDANPSRRFVVNGNSLYYFSNQNPSSSFNVHQYEFSTLSQTLTSANITHIHCLAYSTTYAIGSPTNPNYFFGHQIGVFNADSSGTAYTHHMAGLRALCYNRAGNTSFNAETHRKINYCEGILGYCENQLNGNMNTAIGTLGKVFNVNGDYINSAQGVRGEIDNLNDTNTATNKEISYGFGATVFIHNRTRSDRTAGTTTMIDASGFNADIHSSYPGSTISNAFLYKGNIQENNSGVITNKWGLYLTGTDKHWLTGNATLKQRAALTSLTFTTVKDNSQLALRGFADDADGLFMGNFGDNAGNNPVGYIQYQWDGNSGRPLSINPLGGSVGIGTTNPQNKLHIVNDAFIDGTFGNADFTTHGRLYLNDTNFGIGAGAMSSTVVSDHLYLWAYAAEGRDIRFCHTLNGASSPSNMIPRMTITGLNGSVGIGTTLPQAPLHVQGNIICNDITSSSKVFLNTVTKTTSDAGITITNVSYMNATIYMQADYAGWDRTASRTYILSAGKNSTGGNMTISSNNITSFVSIPADFDASLTFVGTAGSQYNIILTTSGTRSGTGQVIYKVTIVA